MRREVGTARAGGFTIIEVVLFLAISGALIVALLGTVGLAVSRQRFTDSVTGVQAFFQQQFNETLNVVNDRADGDCPLPSGGSGIRGASQCVVLGKAIDFDAGSSHMDVYNVIGTEPVNPGNDAGATLLKDYAPALDQTSKTGYDVPWDANVSGSTGSISRILLLRAPDSGLVLSFGGTGGGAANVTNAVSGGNQAYSLCLRSPDLTATVSTVTIAPVSGTEGVTTKDGNNCG